MPTPPITSRSTRFHSLDLWRGIACLLVLVHHSVYEAAESSSVSWLVIAAQRMWIGVPMFFVISGYCISASADQCRRRASPAGQYFLRRFRRIYPPAWIVLALTCAAVILCELALAPSLLSKNGLFLRPWWLSLSQWAGNFTLTETWRYHLGGDPIKCVYLGHYWTLCVEEQFYVVMGLLVFFAPRHLFAGAAVVTIITLAVGIAKSWIDLPINGFFFDEHWLLFAIGIMVYHVIQFGSVRKWVCAASILSGGVIWAAVEPALLLEPSKNLQQSVFVATLFGLLLLGTHRWDARVAAAQITRPLMAVGMMCYSLYLVHLPINGFLCGLWIYFGITPSELSPLVSIPVCMLVSIVAAKLFFVVVEKRFLNAPVVHKAMLPDRIQVQPS